MTPSKRIFDIGGALVLSVVLFPVVLGVALIIYWRHGGPVFYVSERMKSHKEGFNLWKFRTMDVVQHDSGASGGDKASRITTTGQILRKTRLDEVPQLWNILRGDISFVGPRPPLRCYVEQFPELYQQVLTSRPGVTGLATLVFHKTEERFLAQCETAAQTETVYVTRCIPKKAALDLIYQNKRSVCFDFRLMLATVFRRIPVRLRSK